MLKNVLKWIGYFLIFLLLLFVVIWALLQLPSVQTKIVHQVTKFDLFGSEIFLNQVILNDGFLNIYQHSGDTILNINFLLEAFAADPATDTTATSSTWDFGLNAVVLNRTKIRFDDQVTGMDVIFKSKLLSIDLNKLDLENQSVDIKNILLKNNAVTVLSVPQNIPVTDTLGAASPLTFP